MSVAHIDTAWRRPGCTTDCWPRSHDPRAHERYGRVLERESRQSAVIQTGSLVVDLHREVVMVDGDLIRLSDIEMRTIVHLAGRLDEVCSRQDLLDGVWGVSYQSQCSKNLIRNIVCRMRSRLGSAGALIVTERGRGYRLRRQP